MYQGLIRTCSHPPVVEVTQTDDTDTTDVMTEDKAVTYRDFLPLWRGLLSSENVKDFAMFDFSVSDRRHLTGQIYHQMITAVLRILNKLDLESTLADSAVS